MELSAKYVYKVYQEKSFSTAAKELFISQPALSASIARLEKELGIRIFDRSTVPLSLTPQGRIYIESLEEIMESENNMRQRLRRLSDMTCGSLSVGGSSYTSYHLLSAVCGEFYRRYPNIQVKLDMGNVGRQGNLAEKMKGHTLDLIMTYDYDPREYDATPIFEERVVIAMHKSLPQAAALMPYAVTREELLSKSYSPQKEREDLAIFRDMRFLSFPKGSSTSRKMAQLLGDYAVAPYSIENARHSGMHYYMMRAGLGAVMTTTTMVATMPMGAEDILYFVPAGRQALRTVYLLSQAGSPQNPIAQNFIAVAREVCASDGFLSLSVTDCGKNK